MDFYLVKKEKNKIYTSEGIVYAICGKELSHDELGAPIISDGYISISDTKNYVAVAFSSVPLGIDMEEANREVKETVLKKLHPAEREYMEVLSFGTREWKEEFLSIWTKKESYSKFLGKGLSIGFSKFCVLPGWEHTLKTALYTKKYKDLFISATEEIEVNIFDFKGKNKKSALEAGACILDMFGCSANTMRKKLLSRGYSEDEVESAVEALLERGYLNDDEYSRSLAQKFEKRGYSSRRIEFELRKKGVTEEVAKKYREIYKDGDSDRARKLSEGLPKDKAARKLAAYGYEAHLIYEIV